MSGTLDILSVGKMHSIVVSGQGVILTTVEMLRDTAAYCPLQAQDVCLNTVQDEEKR